MKKSLDVLPLVVKMKGLLGRKKTHDISRVIENSPGEMLYGKNKSLSQAYQLHSKFWQEEIHDMFISFQYK